jgi:hypothetical protein
VTVKAPTLTSFTISPTSVHGGSSAGGVLRLNGKAGPGGVVVTISGGDANVGYATTVTIPAGLTAKSFTITTHPVTSNTVETLTATAGSAHPIASLTLTGP